MKRILLSTVVVFFVVSPAHAVIPDSNEIVFDIIRNGKPFGEHRITFDQQGDKTHVQIDINMRYSLGPVTLFRYTHSNEEIWDGDKIISVRSQTNDDGEKYVVDATWGDVVKVDITDKGEKKTIEAPANIYSTSYWNPIALKAGQLLNTQKGRIEDVSVTKVGDEEALVGGESVMAERYAIDTVLPLEVLYDKKTKQWVGLDFEVRGSEITYRRSNALD